MIDRDNIPARDYSLDDRRSLIFETPIKRSPMNVITRNPWPTLGGILSACGLVLAAEGPESWRIYGLVAAAAGNVLTGSTARQWNVSSERSGAR